MKYFRSTSCGLEDFVAVADSDSLSKAAQKVHLSQPAPTKSIHKLEDELGVKLFDRAGTLDFPMSND